MPLSASKPRATTIRGEASIAAGGVGDRVNT